MARKYDSSRRTEAANHTREAILEAAFKLHSQGIYDFESLAAEANVSVPTVRKHFPTRELLFEGCTAYGVHILPLPDVDAIAATADPIERLQLAVIQVFRLHEEMRTLSWNSYKMEDESPALAKVNRELADVVAIIATLIVEAWGVAPDRFDETRGVVTGLLHPLTYRAFRTYGGLTAEQVIENTMATLLKTLQPLSPPLQEAAHR